MSVVNKTDEEMASLVRQRIAQVGEVAPDSIGDLMDFQLVDCHAASGSYTLRCKTFPWMRNAAGTLHGGMCATIVDQAMGFIAYCVKPGDGIAPTIGMQTSYHRPLIPGEDACISVQVLSITRNLISLTAQVSSLDAPEKICLSASGTYFFKPNP